MFDYRCKLLRVVDGDTIDVNLDLGFNVWHKARAVSYTHLTLPTNREV